MQQRHLLPHPVLVGAPPVWSTNAYSSSKLAYFAANPQYLRVFPLSATCGHAWLGVVAPSLNWKLTCQGFFFIIMLITNSVQWQFNDDDEHLYLINQLDDSLSSNDSIRIDLFIKAFRIICSNCSWMRRLETCC